MNTWDTLRERVKEVPISQVIGQHIVLNKRGQNFLGLCPFHSDTKPSLNVNDSKGMFKCFACGVGGDSITFVEKKYNLGFREAMLELAKQVGIDTSELEEKKKASPKELMGTRLGKLAATLHHKVGLSGTHKVFNDFIKDRGISSEMLDKFQLGMSPASNVISNYLHTIDSKERDLAISTALEIGLVRENKTGGHFDTFRNRIIFPIWDQFNNVVGIGGRATLDRQHGKYINSQDSFLFTKRKTLYGLNFAKNRVRELGQCILVEGYMDVISMHKHDFTQTVAVMGVAISDTSAKTLSTMAKDIVFALDSDQAGLRAMMQMQKLFLNLGIVPRYLSFAPYKDPDEFLQKENSLELKKRIDEAPAFIDHILEGLIPAKIPDNADKKLAILDKCFQELAPLKMDLRATERVISLAKRLGLKSTSEQILDVYKQRLDKSNKGPIGLENEEKLKQIENNTTISPIEAPINTPIPISKLEKTLLLELIHHPECYKHERMGEVLDFIEHPEVKRIVKDLENLYYEVDEKEYKNIVRGLINNESFSLTIRECIGACLYQTDRRVLDDKKMKKLVIDLLKRFKERNLRTLRTKLRREQMECESKERSLEIIKQLSDIEKEIGLLKTRAWPLENK